MTQQECEDAINRACADVCGYVQSTMWPDLWAAPNECDLKPLPDFLRDRNALPALWDALDRFTENQTWSIYFDFVLRGLGRTYYSGSMADAKALLRATSAQHVGAALKALGKWKPEFDQEVTG